MVNKGSIGDILSSWDFSKDHVDSSISRGLFISSKTVLLAAVEDPTKVLTQIANGETSDKVKKGITGRPIGIISDWSVVQQKMLQRLFEVGSAQSYIIPGNTSASFSIGRVMFSGSSVLSEAYNISSDDGDNAKEAGFKIPTDAAANNSDEEYMALNLSAKIFDKPTTLLWLFKNNDNKTVGAYLFVDAQVESYQISGNAQSVIIAENAQFQFTKVYPLNVTAST